MGRGGGQKEVGPGVEEGWSQERRWVGGKKTTGGQRIHKQQCLDHREGEADLPPSAPRDILRPGGSGVALTAQEVRGAAGHPDTQYLLLVVLQSVPGLCFAFVDHGHFHDRIELLQLGKKARHVDGVPGLQDAEDAVQHDGGRDLLPLHQVLPDAVREGTHHPPEHPRGPHANHVIVLVPV